MTQLNDEISLLSTQYARLPAERRREFRSKLRARGISGSLLRIVRVADHGGQRWPLSFAQERLWFLWRMDPADPGYNLGSALLVEGLLDASALCTALTRLVTRHESLRTHFSEQDGTPWQIVQPAPTGAGHEPGGALYGWEEHDLSETSGAEQRGAVDTLLGELALRPFDLECGPLLRVALVRLAPELHVLQFVLHHIIADEWSLGILVRDFAALYAAARSGREVALAPPRIQYGDYALWEREWFDPALIEQRLEYWRTRLGGDGGVELCLPTRTSDGSREPAGGARTSDDVPREVVRELRRLCRERSATLFMGLLAAYQLLLHRYSCEPRVRVGVPVTGREHPDTRDLVGFFVDSLVIDVEIDGAQSFRDLLTLVRARLLEAEAHAVPFRKLVQALQPARSAGTQPLFSTMFNYLVDGAAPELSGLAARAMPPARETTRFALTLTAREARDDLSLSLLYARNRFEPELIEGMARQLVDLLRQVAAAPDAPIARLRLLAPAWDGPAVEYPFCAVHQRFSRTASARGAAPALCCEGVLASYAELEQWSDRIAAELAGKGAGPDARVGVCVERTPGLVAALLGVWKAGAAFLPLDPAYPVDRLGYMLDDSAARWLVVDSSSAARCPEVLAGRELVWLDGPAATPPERAARPAAQRAPHPEQLAYVLYTSGSTGTPKGVGISHRSLSLHIDDFIAEHSISDADTVLHTSTINFDVALHELFPALIAGGRVEMRGDRLWELDELSRHLSEGGVTFARVPTAYWQQWQRRLPAPDSVARLRQVTVGGEGLPGDALARWQRGPLAHVPVANLYGPTETTVACTYRQTTRADSEEPIVPIGRRYPGRSTCVIGVQGSVVPAGISGELCIGGASVARGYLGRPALTAERFVPDPHGQPGARMYRSGDLCRRRFDGTLEYLGRIDRQIKLRGFRIEVGEIEAALRAHAGVREALVEPRGEGEARQLVAYVVGDAEVGTLRRALEQRLPAHMVPAFFVMLPALPLMQNGKVDRGALPEPLRESSRPVAPRTALEARLVEIWRDVLGLRELGIADNFFDLGGDSIISLQIVARARREGLVITPRQIFERQTIEQLASCAHEQQGAAPREAPRGDVALTAIQRRFFESTPSAPDHYNQSTLLVPRQRLAPDVLERALNWIIAQHDGFRLRYVQERDGWRQYYAESAEPTSERGEPERGALVWVRDVDGAAAITALADAAQRSLSLSRGPLARCVLMELPGGEQRLLVVIHHLIVDAVSWRILLADLELAYRAFADGRAPEAPPPSASFQRWSERLLQYAESATARGELGYWRELGARAPCGLQRERPAEDPSEARQTKLRVELDALTTSRLLRDARSAYRSEVQELLLTAFARTLCRWSGAPAAWIGLEGHGRGELFPELDVSRTIGWFTSLYPVCLEPGALGLDASSWAGSIKAVKEQLRGVPNRGVGYGVLRYLAPEAVRAELAALPEPRVLFNYVGQFDASFDERALFAPAPESQGETESRDVERSPWLSLDSHVQAARLTLVWSYRTDIYTAATISQLATELGAELRALVEHCLSPDAGALTPSDFPLARLTQEELDGLGLAPQEFEDIYPLSPMQQGMLFHALYSPEQRFYVNQVRVRVKHLDVARFRCACELAVRTHDILRTGFAWRDAARQPLQIVYRSAPARVDELDWRERDTSAARLDALAEAELGEGVDLARPPLQRVLLVRIAEREHELIWTHHHLMLDGWSFARLVTEILQSYAGAPIARPLCRYRDYIAWLARRDAAASERFWREQTRTLEEPTLLASAFAAPAAPSCAGAAGLGALHASSTIEQGERWREFVRQERVTINTLVQAAWAILLQEHTGRPTIAFGATVSGRPECLPGVEAAHGLFINTLPVIISPRPREEVGEFLRRLQEHNLALRQHEHTPLYDVQRWGAGGGRSLFDTILVFENYPIDRSLQGAQAYGLELGRVVSSDPTSYPLTLSVQLGERLSVTYDFLTSHFDQAAIEALHARLIELLEALAQSARRPLGRLPRLPEAAARALLTRQRGARVDHGFEQGYVRLFEASVRATPERCAVRCRERAWTYSELNERANRVGRLLVAHGVAPEDLVAVLGERELELLALILGSMKAGAGYVPLDPRHPPARLADVLRLSRARVLLTLTGASSSARAALEQMSAAERPELLVPEQLELGEEREDLAIYAAPRQLAYMIHTSGSSGAPKGVLVEQRGMLNNQLSKVPYLGLGAQDIVAQTASQCFDISVWQFLTALLCGAQVEIVPDEIAHDPPALLAHVAERGVTVLESVPSTIQGMLNAEAVALPALRVLLPTGEALPHALARQWFARYPDIPLVNAYGPAECSDDVSLLRLTQAGESARGYVALGFATDNLSLFVLDSSLRVVPPGMVGELWVAGIGVGRGYAGDPARTAAAFVPHPYAEAPGERLYRTGDLARYAGDGSIEFVGRVDQQIKLRGFRIELGEIEARLAAQQDVAEAAAAVVDGASGRRLVAFVAWREGRGGSLSALREGLERTLPDYMIPAQIAVLPALPRTPNGKLDRKALPEPQLAARSHVAPLPGLEAELAAIWQELLGVPSVGAEDDFFELGGHSLTAVQLCSRVRRRLGLELGLRQVFAARTLRALAERVARASRDVPSAAPLVRLPRGGPLELSYAQERQWLLWRLGPDSAAYNIPIALRLSGPLEHAALRDAVGGLIERHEILRTRFALQDGRARAWIEPARAPELALVDLSALEPGPREQRALALGEAEASRPFNLEVGPLLRLQLLCLDAADHVLLATLHHAISDGWSGRVIAEEFVELYRAACAARSPRLRAQTIQYADYAAWQRRRVESGELEHQLAYWKNELGAEHPRSPLVTELARPPVQSHAAASHRVELSRALTRELVQLGHGQGATLFMILLAAFAATLRLHSRQSAIRIGVPSANRNRLELEGVIGPFVNMLVVQLRVERAHSYRELLAQVGQRVIAAQANQDLPFEQLVEALEPAPAPAHHPLFQVMYHHATEPRADRGRFELEVEAFPCSTQATPFDLSLVTAERGEAVSCTFTYCRALFEPARVEALAEHFLGLLEAVAAAPEQRLSQIDALRRAVPGELAARTEV